MRGPGESQDMTLDRNIILPEPDPPGAMKIPLEIDPGLLSNMLLFVQSNRLEGFEDFKMAEAWRAKYEQMRAERNDLLDLLFNGRGLLMELAELCGIKIYNNSKLHDWLRTVDRSFLSKHQERI